MGSDVGTPSQSLLGTDGKGHWRGRFTPMRREGPSGMDQR